MSQAANLTTDQSQQLIYSQLIAGQIPDPLAKLVTAQSGHETYGWTSNVYLTDNNGFGYGWNGHSYTSYPDVESSVSDIVGYLNRRVADGSFPPLDQITDATQYATLLKSVNYYEDTETNYLAGIQRWFNNNLTVVIAGSAGMLIFALLLFILFSKK